MKTVRSDKGEPRQFVCDICGDVTLKAYRMDTGKLFLNCPCGYHALLDAPVALENEDGSASFIGTLMAGCGL